MPSGKKEMVMDGNERQLMLLLGSAKHGFPAGGGGGGGRRGREILVAHRKLPDYRRSCEGFLFLSKKQVSIKIKREHVNQNFSEASELKQIKTRAGRGWLLDQRSKKQSDRRTHPLIELHCATKRKPKNKIKTKERRK